MVEMMVDDNNNNEKDKSRNRWRNKNDNNNNSTENRNKNKVRNKGIFSLGKLKLRNQKYLHIYAGKRYPCINGCDTLSE